MRYSALLALLLVTLFQYVEADTDSVSWVMGNINGISHIKNKKGEVETVLSVRVKKYSNLEPERIINYLQFKVYVAGGRWDGVEYPLDLNAVPGLGKSALLNLSYKDSKFYATSLVQGNSLQKFESLVGESGTIQDTSKNFQLGSLSSETSKERAPAQIKKKESTNGDNFGIFFFSLFLIVFGVSLYLTSRNNQNE